MCLNDKVIKAKLHFPPHPPSHPLCAGSQGGGGTSACSTNTATRFTASGRQGAGRARAAQVAGAIQFAALQTMVQLQSAKEGNEGERTGVLKTESWHHFLLKVMRLAWVMPNVFPCASTLSLHPPWKVRIET